MRVLDGLARQASLGIRPDGGGRDEIAGGRVQRTVCSLDDRGIVVLTTVLRVSAVGIAFEMSRPPPRLSLIIRDGYGETVAARFQIVVDERPVAILQDENLSAGARIRPIAILAVAPGVAPIGRQTDHQALGRWPVVAHIGDERAV